MSSSAEAEAVVRSVMDRWKAAVDSHEPGQVAAEFTEDAIFQGLQPYSVGKPGVAAYYDSQPRGMAAVYRILETREPADGFVLSYLAVDFSFTDRPTVGVWLSVLLKRTDEGWRISHYQVSRLG
jgi:uncharacterized protein (TIGR02246 family)